MKMVTEKFLLLCIEVSKLLHAATMCRLLYIASKTILIVFLKMHVCEKSKENETFSHSSGAVWITFLASKMGPIGLKKSSTFYGKANDHKVLPDI